MATIFINPNEGRLRSGWRLAIQLCILIAVALAILTPFVILLTIASFALGGISTGGLPGQLPDESWTVWLTLIFGVVIETIAITVSIFLARRFADRRSFASLGLWRNRRSVRDLVAGFLIAGLMIGLMFLIELLGGWLVVRDLAFSHTPVWMILLQMLAMFLGFVLVGWSEELLFRGYWLQNLSEGLGLGLGILISSVLFSLAHLGNPGFSAGALAGLFLAGLFFAYSLLRSGNLWLPIGLHIGWNFFEGPIFGFQVSGLEAFRLVEHSVQGPDLVVGGAFGPEAGLVLLPGLAIGVLLIHIYTRRRETAKIPLVTAAQTFPSPVDV
ncbi:MAG TPA: type II CAAX endopeptidase family protein [Anaerolineales bacterium]|nr:type II CAAX endopeptidase family protein [Anaerolineales bacterium]